MRNVVDGRFSGRRVVLGMVGMLALAAMIFPVAGLAQIRERSVTINSDRPGLGDGAHVLAGGVWQAEVGGIIDAVIDDEYLVGSALVRIGFEALELRVFVPSLYGFHQGDVLGLGDLGVGAKIPVELGAQGWRMAATGALTAATGSKKISAGDTGGDVTFIAETELSETVGLALNSGYGFLFDGFGDGTFSLLATPTFALPETDGLSLYAGLAAYLRPGDDAYFVEFGLTKLDGMDRQWDINAGYDRGGHVWFLGVGVAQRW